MLDVLIWYLAAGAVLVLISLVCAPGWYRDNAFISLSYAPAMFLLNAGLVVFAWPAFLLIGMTNAAAKIARELPRRWREDDWD
jgi:hypothetical protein